MRRYGTNDITNAPVLKQVLVHSNNGPLHIFQVETENVRINEVWLKTIAYNIKQLAHRKVRLAIKRGEL